MWCFGGCAPKRTVKQPGAEGRKFWLIIFPELSMMKEHNPSLSFEKSLPNIRGSPDSSAGRTRGIGGMLPEAFRKCTQVSRRSYIKYAFCLWRKPLLEADAALLLRPFCALRQPARAAVCRRAFFHIKYGIHTAPPDLRGDVAVESARVGRRRQHPALLYGREPKAGPDPGAGVNTGM